MENSRTNLPGLAHDLRNIMAVIRLYAQLGLQDDSAGKTIKEFLRIIADQAASANELVEMMGLYLPERIQARKISDLKIHSHEEADTIVPATIAADSSKRLEVLLSNLPGLAYRCMNAPGWPMEFMSEGCYQLTGYRPEEFIIKKRLQYEDIIHPDDRLYVNNTIQECVSKGEPFTLEYRIRTRSGEEKRVWEKGRQISHTDDPTRRLEGFIMDITERINTEEALRLSEEKYARIFETSPFAIIITRLSDGMILDANPLFEQLFGYTRTELLGNTSIRLNLWANTEDRSSVIQDLLNEKRVYNREYQYKTKAGEIRTGLYSAAIILLNDVKYLLSSINDITQLKHSEEALRKSQGKLMGIFKISPSGIGLVKNRVLTEVNDRICEMTGYQAYELIGKSSLILYPTRKEFENVGKEKYRQISQTGIGILETRWKKRDGTVIDILLASTPLINGDDDAGVVFTALDITNLKQAEAEKKKMEEQLLQALKMETIGKLVGGVAHEFNNTLQVINTLTELSLLKLEKDNQVVPHLEQVMTSVRQSSSFVTQLLAFARKQPVNPESINPNEFINGLIIIVQRIAGERIELEWNPGKPVWMIKIDPVQLNQVLMNLIINARDAIPGEGRITIETGIEVVTEPVPMEDQECAPGEYEVIAIRDTGCGIDPEIQAKIFDPFFTTKPKGKGTGLGLSTVYGIVRQNNGFIIIDSMPGEGTSCRVYFPRHYL